MSLLDESIDARTVQIEGEELAIRDAFAAVFGKLPDVATLRDAARKMPLPTPAMLKARGHWDTMLAAMDAAAFDDEAKLRVLMRATMNAYQDVDVYQPPNEVLEEVLVDVDQELAAAAVRAFQEAELNYGQQQKAGLAVVALGRHAEIPAELDALVEFGLPVELMREFLDSVGPQRRKAKLDELLMTEPLNRLNAFWRAELGVKYLELLDEQQVARLREVVDGIVSGKPDRDEERVAELCAAFDRGSFDVAEELERDEDGLTDAARRSLEYWVQKIAEERMKNALGPLAESRLDVAIEIDAPELETLASWNATDEARQQEIATMIAERSDDFGLTFVGFEVYDEDAPVRIAVFENEHTQMRLSLVPGGTYLRGFSEREEHIVIEAGEDDPEAGNWYETYQYLIDKAATMRPTQQVTVGPLLVFQIPSDAIDPAETTAMFEELPFRLMTEAEHEWVARGGLESELTWRGDEVPDEAWMEEIFDAGPSMRNAFGMAMLGMTPEALTDVYVDGYEGAPTDGSARCGDGPRVVRGGAEMLFPWQACGEWQLLTNSVRTSTRAWEYFLAIRPAIGLRIG